MPLLSPGILVKEKDFTTIVPVVASAIGGIAAGFDKGPLNTPILISSESNLLEVFGKPNENNYGAWFSASQFLNYTNKLWVVRAVPTGAFNATSTANEGVLIENYDDYQTKRDAAGAQGIKDTASPTPASVGTWIAKQPGTAGTGIKVVMVDAANYAATLADPTLVDNTGKKYVSFLPGKPGTSQYVTDKSVFDTLPKNDELSMIVIDTLGTISGKINTVIETFSNMSKASDATDYKNSSTYYVDVINSQSQYVYWNLAPTNSGDANSVAFGALASAVSSTPGADRTFKTFSTVIQDTLVGGVAGSVPDTASIKAAYDVFENVEEIDVNLLLTGNHLGTVCAYVIELAATRKDAIAFVSPHLSTFSGTAFNVESAGPFVTRSTMVTDLEAFKTALNVSDQMQSYGVMDTGYKYIYDQYNKKYRWVPLNGDVAGICARTDDIADPWWSPGGFNRGGVRNIIKLSFNPNQSERDVLYPKGINPVVTFPGSGTILFGDRTMQEKPSAFDRINVRRLFIILEKAISVAAKYQLFEFNDSFTRAQFKNMVEPFLRDIQGRRGITDFKVICDESNNTGEVIDRNEFIADIYVKPARSINFIMLNFVATKTGVEFSTVVGG